MHDVSAPERGEESYEFTVMPGDDFARLDRFLAEKLRDTGLSREKIKNLIKSGNVLVDGRPETSPRQPLLPGRHITVALPPYRTRLQAEEGELTVCYRDACLAVLDKPAGLTVHPAPGRPTGTLAHRLVAHFPELAALEGFRPGIVHRLDKDTSGLMLVALTEPCRLALAKQFADHDVFKEYLALVRGVPEQPEGVVEAPIGRHPASKTRMAVVSHGKSAKSAWRVLYADPEERFALMAVRIFSGRTHQVRVHMRHIGHPLWGDRLYGDSRRTSREPDRQMLHAWKLAFRHPFPELMEQSSAVRADGGRLSFLRPPPEDFRDCLRTLASRMLRIVVTGSPGSGKSTLAGLLAQQGLPCFSADAEIAAQYAPGRDGHRLLRSCFGDRFAPDDKAPIDKAALGKAMRRDDALRRRIEDLLHPIVWHALETFWQQREQDGCPMAVAEIPLYLESPAKRDIRIPEHRRPVLVGVHCPFKQRQQRLRLRGWSDEVIARMESWQWPEEKKMRACDIVVENTGGIDRLRDQIPLLLARLERLSQASTEQTLALVERIWNGDPRP